MNVIKATFVIGNSSNVQEVSYAFETKEMTVRYNGGEYVYHGVPTEIFLEIPVVESVGKWLNEKVKGIYHFRKVA